VYGFVMGVTPVSMQACCMDAAGFVQDDSFTLHGASADPG